MWLLSFILEAGWELEMGNEMGCEKWEMRNEKWEMRNEKQIYCQELSREQFCVKANFGLFRNNLFSMTVVLDSARTDRDLRTDRVWLERTVSSRPDSYRDRSN